MNPSTIIEEVKSDVSSGIIPESAKSVHLYQQLLVAYWNEGRAPEPGGFELNEDELNEWYSVVTQINNDFSEQLKDLSVDLIEAKVKSESLLS